MKILSSADFDVHRDSDVTKQLIAMIAVAKECTGPVQIEFENGNYFIDSEKCEKHMLYITNCVGDNEFSADEVPHLNAVAMFFQGLTDFVFNGNGAKFFIDGKVTNVAIQDCTNITLENFSIQHLHPDMHEMLVTKKSLFSVDFGVDADTLCKYENGVLSFYGKDFSCEANKNSLNAHWIGLIKKATPETVKRVNHPLFGSLKIKKTSNQSYRVKFLNTFRFRKGDRYYLFDVRRQFAGIFVDFSKNIMLKNISQHFNYSLALVAQNCDTLTAENLNFAPSDNSSRKMASVADFIQICMCRGLITIKNSLFDGAGDDCLNVHGIHFKIIEKSGEKIKVKFMHAQSHGFNPLRVGDLITFISPDSLLEHGKAKILSSVMLNEYEIDLVLSSSKDAVLGEVIENINACPDVEFSGNTLTRIITRGLLLTTRGKVNIENNHFVSSSMSGILLSDDAKNWYESGMCRDVTIRNNRFDYCGKTPILIKPENSVHKGYVHSNINIISNKFKNYSGKCIKIKSSENIKISCNSFRNKNRPVNSKNCKNITIE